MMRNLIDHADLLYHLGKCDEAVELLSESYRSHRNTHAVRVRLAELLVDSGLYQKALELLDGSGMGDGDGQILSIVGFCHEALRNTRKAEEAAEKLLSFDGQRANAFTLKAMLALQFGDEERAEKLFHQAIKCDSSCAWALLGLGQFLGNRGKVDAGIDYLEKAFRIMPASRSIALAFHEMAVRSMKYSTAENAFRKVLAHRPLHRRLRFLLIDLLLRQDKYADGILQIESTMADFGVDDGMLSAALSIRQRLDILQNGKPKEPNRRPTITLCMIVKNEECSLPRCLQSVKPIVNEMIVVDTGSTDRTRQIAAAFGAKVFDFAWNNDFSAPRNYSLSKATGDWILVLDADECLAPMDGALLTKTVKNSKNKKFAYRMITRNYTNQAALRGWTANNGEYYGIEAGEGWIPSVKVRLFPNREGIAFVGAVHELVEPTLSRLRMRMKDCNVPVHHYGKLDPAKVIKKGPEYYRLGIKKIEDTNGGYQALKELAIQASEIEEYHEAVKIWEKVIATNPTDAPAYLNAGYACFMLKQYEKAAILSNKALELAPDLREAALNLAGCEFMLGNVQCAISLLETILAKEPDYPPAMGRLAAVYLIDGRKEEGFKYIRSLNQRNYNAIQLIEEQAQALDAQGRADHAMRLHAAIRQFNEHCQNEFLLYSKRRQICVEGNSETPHLACSNIVQLGGQALGVD